MVADQGSQWLSVHATLPQVVCTIGPATWDRERLFQLADAGMNVARLNMSHGDHASHKRVRLNILPAPPQCSGVTSLACVFLCRRIPDQCNTC